MISEVNPSWAIHKERTWQIGCRAYRPDATIVDGTSCKILEVTVPYETSLGYLDQRAKEKKDKYQVLKNSCGAGIYTSVEILSVVVGSLGTMTKECIMTLKSLGIAHWAHRIQCSATVGTVRIIRNQLSSNDFDIKKKGVT